MINFKFGIGTFLGDNMNVIVMGYFLGRCIPQEMKYCVKVSKQSSFLTMQNWDILLLVMLVVSILE